jgi:hypothetical protein
LSDEGTKEVDVPAHFRVYKFNWTRSDVKYVIFFLDDRLVFVKTGTDLDAEGIIWYMSEVARIGMRGGGRYMGPIGVLAAGMAIDVVRGTAGQAILKKYDEQVTEFIAAVSGLTVPEILELDKDNFEIPYSEITAVKIKKEGILGEPHAKKGRFFVEWKRKDKFEIMVTEDFDECRSIVESYFSMKMK